MLARYDLGELKAVHRIERGFVNENWLVETTRGRYFLKHRLAEMGQPDSSYISPSVVFAQHALIAWLRRAGFPAPTIIPATSGESLLVLEGELYEIHEYIEGEPYDHDRPAHLEEAAATLGCYHTCVQGFAPQALRDLGELYSPTILSANLGKLIEAWELEGNPDATELIRKLEGHAADLAARFAQAPGQRLLPHLVIHGDYYAGNLLFDGERIVGVVDYDKARWQARVVELAEALIYFASPRPGHLKHLVYPGFLRWQPFTRFLYRYARVVSLKEDEVCALPDYIRCIWLSMSLRRLWERGAHPAFRVEALQEALALGNWAQANTQRMIEAGRAAIDGGSTETGTRIHGEAHD